MKRLLAVPFLAVGLLAWSGVAVADHEETIKPACANIAEADVAWNSTTNIVTGEVIISGTDGPSCKSVTYSLVVDNGTTASSKGNGTNSVVVATQPIAGVAGDDICFYVTSSRGKHTFDRFPNDGCTTVPYGGSGGGIGHG